MNHKLTVLESTTWGKPPADTSKTPPRVIYSECSSEQQAANDDDDDADDADDTDDDDGSSDRSRGSSQQQQMLIKRQRLQRAAPTSRPPAQPQQAQRQQQKQQQQQFMQCWPSQDELPLPPHAATLCSTSPHSLRQRSEYQMPTTTTKTTVPKSTARFPAPFSSMFHHVSCFLLLSAVVLLVADAAPASDTDDGGGHYTHTWAVHIPGGRVAADTIAAEHGFENLGTIIDDHYFFKHNHVHRRSAAPADREHTRLADAAGVHWAQQQRVKSRQKRDFTQPRNRQQQQRQRKASDLATEARWPLNDPKWSQMWYLNRGNGLDMNVIPAWQAGITGKGVVVTILDDGLELDHPDLAENYDKDASYDVNSHDSDPMPHYDMTDSNRHGTRCAGEVAATANNSLCSVGIAYGARVGGVRMLDGDVTDAVEARSLSHNTQHIDIYSASWGPDDDGKTVDGPGEMATRAFIEGVTKGRRGRGSIFVWASGNGGREHDNCNCDGYTNSIWTLSISSATEEGHVPWYSEKCSSTLATTYSSGGSTERQIVTTDLHHTCTASHTGTSASAPLAAGIVALVLEANGNLTWRDLQHIVVRTSKPGNLIDSTWSKNGIGRRVSHSFGYGLMDAAAMVTLARKWKTVPEQQRCEINAPHLDTTISPKNKKTLLLDVQQCSGVNFLEHVQAKITLTSQRRGDIVIYLISPAGTRVTLLTARTHDESRSGFSQWPFMSVHTWGEAPHGSWLLEIHNEGRAMGHAALKGWSLIFYGTTQRIDSSDPTSVRLEPNAAFSAGKYPIIGTGPPGNGGGGGGGGSGGKQNNRQKSKTSGSNYGAKQSSTNSGSSSSSSTSTTSASSSFASAGSRKASNKQSKVNGFGKSGGGGGGGGGGNRNRSSTTTTSAAPRGSQQQQQQQPFGSMTLLNYNRYTPADRTRMYNISNYLASLTAPTTTTTTIRSNTSTTTTIIPPANGRQPAAAARPKSVAKVVTANRIGSVKAPKQAVSRPTPPPATTARPRNIPAKFQNYEKVQEIYPEFQAFDGGPQFHHRQSSTSLSQSASAAAGRRIENDDEDVDDDDADAVDIVVPPQQGNSDVLFASRSSYAATRSKTSKNNQFFAEQQQHSGSSGALISLGKAAAGAGNTANSTQILLVRSPAQDVRSSSSSASTHNKQETAQITQWEMILHGTDTPAQPDDRPANQRPKLPALPELPVPTDGDGVAELPKPSAACRRYRPDQTKLCIGLCILLFILHLGILQPRKHMTMTMMGAAAAAATETRTEIAAKA